MRPDRNPYSRWLGEPERSTSSPAPAQHRTEEHDQGADDNTDDAGKVLVALDRGQRGDPPDAPRERLVLREKSYQGRPFFDARIHYRADDASYRPTRKGVSIRRKEAPEVIAALWKALDTEGRDRVRALLGGKDGGR